MEKNLAHRNALYGYSSELFDLGQLDDRLKGVLSKGYSQEEMSLFMSAHYMDEENVLKQQFDLVTKYAKLLHSALGRCEPKTVKTALELGSGFGSASFAALELLPDAKFLLTEFSLEMLARLKRAVEQRKYSGRVKLMQLNVEELDFADGSFDFIFGAAILHHLFTPAQVIESVYRLLTPGGIAFFSEPFEPAYGVLNFIYKILLDESERGLVTLDKGQRDYLRHSIWHWNNMLTKPKSDNFYIGTDDKWLFPTNYLETVAKRAGFRFAYVDSVDESILQDDSSHIKNLLNVHTTGNGVYLPERIYELHKLFNGSFSRDQIRVFIGDGTLVLQK